MAERAWVMTEAEAAMAAAESFIEAENRLLILGRCPVSGCGVEIRDNILMCARCWRQVPAALKQELRLSGRTARRNLSDEARDIAYRRWRDDAIAAIEAVQDA